MRPPNRRLTRRQFLAGSAVAAGDALAVRPIAAETIATSGEGLVAGEVRIAAEGREIPGYRAMPAVPAEDGWKRMLDRLRRHGTA
jgi:carboxymethylenebutenolidase